MFLFAGLEVDFAELKQGRRGLVQHVAAQLQEEAPAFGKPVLAMREVTKRPEGIDAGVANRVGASEEGIATETVRLLRDRAVYEAMRKAVNPYGDGTAAREIVDVLERVS